MAGRIIGYLTLVFIGIYLIFPTGVHAQTPSSSPSAPIPPAVSPTSPIYTDLLVHNLFHSFSCLATGSSIIGQPCLTYQVQKNAQGAIQSIPVLSQTNLSGGALGATTSLIAALYMNPPVRTIDYLASLGESFGLVKEAKAQVVGAGQAVLNPILSLWTVSRNIAYLIMIIIFVVVGLMVMFRNRINPQTVITAQAALPGLVIGLVLITFSYFFAGLISDFAFIGTNIVGYYFQAAQSSPPPGTATCPNPANLVECAERENVLSIFSRFTGAIGLGDIQNAVGAIWGFLPGGVQMVMRVVTGFMLASFSGQTVGALFPGMLSAITSISTFLLGSVAPEFSVSLVFYIIAVIMIVYSMLRLLLRLLNNYLSIIFLTITAPFQFLAAALPGRQGIATTWVFHMLANILAFPAVLAVFYFVAFLLGGSFGPIIITDLGITPDNALVPTALAQTPPSPLRITGTATFPLFGGLDLNFIRILLAFGALIALPAIPDIIARTIGAVSQAGQLIGQEISGSTGAGRGYFGQGTAGVRGGAQQIGPLSTKYGLEPVVETIDGKNVIVYYRSASPLYGGAPSLLTRLTAFGKIVKPPEK